MTRIISWNVNGIRSVHKKNLFLPFIDEYQPDILCLQETKAERGQITIDLPNYKEFWNSAVKKGYSGTAIFTKVAPLSSSNDFPTSFVKKFKLDEDNYGNPNSEGRVITLEYKDFFVVNVYTPNAKDDLSRLKLRSEKWDIVFLEYLKSLESKKPVIFCGDLNVAHLENDLARPKENDGNKGFTREERDGFQNFINAGFVDTFRMFEKDGGHYTWWSNWANARERNVGWRIDYFLVSEKLEKRVVSAKILDKVFGSDHCPVLLELK